MRNTHPEAYAEITKSLPKISTPPDSNTTSQQHGVTMATKTYPVTMVPEDVIVPQGSAVSEGQTTTTVHVSNRKELIEDFVNVLPSGDLKVKKVADEDDSDSSLDDSPVAGVRHKLPLYIFVIGMIVLIL